MKKRIVAIGIVSMFLLTGLTTISAVGMETEEFERPCAYIHKLQINNPVEVQYEEVIDGIIYRNVIITGGSLGYEDEIWLFRSLLFSSLYHRFPKLATLLLLTDGETINTVEIPLLICIGSLISGIEQVDNPDGTISALNIYGAYAIQPKIVWGSDQ